MLDWLKRRSRVQRKAGDLYGRVVAAARNPWFYGDERVADTPEGRFELIAMHLFLAAERVKTLPPDGEATAQQMIEAFVTDMDDCMREMGVGDLTVPKRVKRAAATFYERAGAYRAGLAATPLSGVPDPLAAVVTEAMRISSDDKSFAAGIAAYMRASQAILNQTSAKDFDAGIIAFAAPQSAARRPRDGAAA